MSALAPYEHLLSVLRTRLDRLADGDLDGFAALDGDHRQALAALPPVAPEGSRPLLEEILAITEVLESSLTQVRTTLLGKLAAHERSSAVTHAYQDPEAAGFQVRA